MLGTEGEGGLHMGEIKFRKYRPLLKDLVSSDKMPFATRKKAEEYIATNLSSCITQILFENGAFVIWMCVA